MWFSFSTSGWGQGSNKFLREPRAGPHLRTRVGHLERRLPASTLCTRLHFDSADVFSQENILTEKRKGCR